MSSRRTMLTMPPIASAPCLTEIESSCTSTRSTALSGSWFRSNALTEKLAALANARRPLIKTSVVSGPRPRSSAYCAPLLRKPSGRRNGCCGRNFSRSPDRCEARALDLLLSSTKPGAVGSRERPEPRTLDVMTSVDDSVVRAPASGNRLRRLRHIARLLRRRRWRLRGRRPPHDGNSLSRVHSNVSPVECSSSLSALSIL